MLRINTTSKYAEFKSDTKSDLYPLNEISYTVENESETVSFYNRFYNKIMTEQISNIQVNDVPVSRDNIQDLLSVLFAANEGGGSGGTVDLSNYYTKPEVDAKIDTKVDKVEGKQLSTEDYTTEEKTKLAGLENYDDTIVKADIASNTAAIEAEVERATAAEKVNADAISALDTAYKAADVTLDTKIDAEVTRATNAESELNTKIDTKVDKVDGKQLSTEDYTTVEKEKLASLSNYDDTTVKGDIVANTAAIEAEVTRAKGAENTLNEKFDTKADKDKYEKVPLNELSNNLISVFVLNRDIKYHYIDLNEATVNIIQILVDFSFYKEIDEVHLFFIHNDSKTYSFSSSIIWKEIPSEMVDGATYEFIFTNFKSQNKVYGGYIKYE
jgi:hypothetical protein